MICQTCDYRLWNIASRTCPECGTAFKPSEFEFIANSVAFHCPHCRQAYYGTAANGHLEPFAFDCSGCGHAVDMDQMILLPTAGIEEEQTKVDEIPWTVRQKIGVLTAWLRTVGRALIEPGRLIAAAPPTGGTLQSLWFLLITSLVVAVGATSWIIAIGAIVAGGSMMWILSMVGGLTLGTLAAVLVFALVWMGLAHLVLVISGPRHGGFNKTAQSIAYSSGANIGSGIPIVGYYVGWIWWIVSAVVMLKNAQRVSALRAVFAGITPFVLVVVGFISLQFFVLSGLRFGQAMGTGNSFNVGSLTYGLLQYDMKNRPKHMLSVLADDHVSYSDFTYSMALVPFQKVTVAGKSLTDFDLMMSDAEQQEIVDSYEAAMTNDIVAYRLGDYIFTYPGIDFDNDPGDLWLVVEWPRKLPPTTTVPGMPPSTNSTVIINGPGGTRTTVTNGVVTSNFVIVGLLDGSTKSIMGTFASELAEQNRLRKSCGLPPIPPLDEVTEIDVGEIGDDAANENGSGDE